jgi:hypothetical protein
MDNNSTPPFTKVPFDTLVIKEGDTYKINITSMITGGHLQEGDSIRILPGPGEIWFLRKTT